MRTTNQKKKKNRTLVKFTHCCDDSLPHTHRQRQLLNSQNEQKVVSHNKSTAKLGVSTWCCFLLFTLCRQSAILRHVSCLQFAHSSLLIDCCSFLLLTICGQSANCDMSLVCSVCLLAHCASRTKECRRDGDALLHSF